MNLEKYLEKSFTSQDYIKPNYWSARFAWIRCQKEAIKIAKKHRKNRKIIEELEKL